MLAGLPNLSNGFLQRDKRPVRRRIESSRVFILHDANPQWLKVKHFIEERCGLETDDFGPAVDLAGDSLASKIRDPLSRCGFAVCILGADIPHGLQRPQQRIVHQTGILHGTYGFGRVAILIEDGCDIFTNISGLIRMVFPKGNVEAKFVDLHRMLIRELHPNARSIGCV